MLSKRFVMPKSANTVTKHILHLSAKTKNDLKEKIDNLKKQNVKFSLTVDEWSDNCMKRYLNVSLHVLSADLIKKFDVYVLGLVEIKGHGRNLILTLKAMLFHLHMMELQL